MELAAFRTVKVRYATSPYLLDSRVGQSFGERQGCTNATNDELYERAQIHHTLRVGAWALAICAHTVSPAGACINSQTPAGPHAAYNKPSMLSGITSAMRRTEFSGGTGPSLLFC